MQAAIVVMSKFLPVEPIMLCGISGRIEAGAIGQAWGEEFSRTIQGLSLGAVIVQMFSYVERITTSCIAGLANS
jgi:hypothetical protein